jgi:hypothetical protein
MAAISMRRAYATPSPAVYDDAIPAPGGAEHVRSQRVGSSATMEAMMAQKGAGGNPGAVTKKGGDGAGGSTGTGRGGGKGSSGGKTDHGPKKDQEDEGS